MSTSLMNFDNDEFVLEIVVNIHLGYTLYLIYWYNSFWTTGDIT